MHKRTQGFTLIEVMITVVIIAILAAVAIPSYGRYVIRAHRSEGQALLTEAAARLERYYAQNYAYTSTAADLAMRNTSNGTVSSDNGYYTLSITVNTDTSSDYSSYGPYLLTATAAGTQAKDTECGNLTLSAQGAKGATGTGAAADCWR
ncbi:type IV pilus assembly protein PilE [Pseudomonas duriflava]|uniref:Type IV pilus assembly protein PilE n=1 Tax=Pseudomonas duriflava TaxID=459528 RepID=A0A562QFB2_9PSED|nr:type IV pilin protein [Pseudomonas duriflava]TWI54860.1 type IV pilus assembly protein PilE [Pseudomonas duriflava]